MTPRGGEFIAVPKNREARLTNRRADGIYGLATRKAFYLLHRRWPQLSSKALEVHKTMRFEDIFKVVSMVLVSFGGGAIIVIGLAKWLGNVLASRILQTEQAKFDTQLESFRHELGIKKSSYEHHLDLILDYYAIFYKHYRLCQRTAYADAYRQLPNGEIKHTKDEFIESLGDFLSGWTEKEGRIRLLLPSPLLTLHERAIVKFNEFKNAVHDFTPAEPTPRKKELIFREINEIKIELENGLREFLRTESLLK